ncbi:MAG: hypothetical protein AABW92_00765 [Nanoarchaeota archaeon]
MKDLKLGELYQLMSGENAGYVGYLTHHDLTKGYTFFSGKPFSIETAVLSISDPVHDAKTHWFSRKSGFDIEVNLDLEKLCAYEVGNNVELKDLKEGDKVLYQETTATYAATVRKPMHGNWFTGRRVEVNIGPQKEQLYEDNYYGLKILQPKNITNGD